MSRTKTFVVLGLLLLVSAAALVAVVFSTGEALLTANPGAGDNAASVGTTASDTNEEAARRGAEAQRAEAEVYDAAAAAGNVAEADRNGIFPAGGERGRLGDLAGGAGSGSGGGALGTDGTSTDTVTQKAEPVAFAGVVITDTGRPVEGSRVTLAVPPGEAGLDLSGVSPSLGEETGSDGSFAFRGIRGAGSLSVTIQPPADWFVSQVMAMSMQITPGRDITGAKYVLEDGDLFEGVVLNEEDVAIQGAALSTTLRGTTPVKTDKQGYFAVRVQRGQTLPALTASHPDYEAEERLNVGAFDGFQTFRLRRDSDAELVVTWAYDGSPVMFYSYKLLQLGPTGRFVLTDRRETEVETRDGRTALPDLPSDDYRAEITVMNPEGGASDIRGMAEFTLEAGKSLEVPVSITVERALTGRVIQGEGGPPVPGVEVEFLPPSAGFNNRPQLDAALMIPPVVTDAQGAFSVDGVPPGTYGIKVEADGWRTAQAFDITMPYEGEPEPVDIVLSPQGVIFGTVTQADGTPGAGWRVNLAVQRLDADGWTWSGAETDETGAYRIENLPAGMHWLYLNRGEGNAVAQKRYDLTPGEEAELSFDLGEGVTVTGQITVGGQIPNNPSINLSFGSETVRTTKQAQVDPTGAYSAVLSPGRWVPAINVPGVNTTGTHPAFDIPEGVTAFQQDFDISSASADVLLVFAEGETFAAGQVAISPRDRFLRHNFLRIRANQENRHVPDMVPGEYKATFTSFDKQWTGETDWVTIGEGEENVFVIDVERRAAGVLVGEYGPDDLSMAEFRPVRFALGELPADGATAEFLVTYIKGRHAIEIGGARLLSGGQVIAQDNHPGWSGADQWNNTYRLPLGNAREGLQLEVDLRSDGGTDSHGAVYLTVR
ncbi:MAG: carboxypeptidase-like regulatory domain-containing protein [Sumerlaeia bacterium]